MCPSLLPPLLLLLLLCARAAPVRGDAAPVPTYRDTDPVTGAPVECDRCPPGSYLRSTCTATSKSVCAQCPPGSFTELWNYIGKCLRCGVCGHDQVMKTPCAAHTDCQCECKQGHYHRAEFDMGARHSESRSGHEVLTRGTADEDTVCQVCPNGTYSDTVSALHECTLHRGCDAPGMQMVLKGSSWHDSVCTSCKGLSCKDAGDYLREILPAFFVHQKIHPRRLRRILNRLPSESGKNHGASGLGLSDHQARINAWVASATAAQIRQLPAALTRSGADGAGHRLLSKLQRIEWSLSELNDSRNEVDNIVQ
uniref:LOW QUALITY PROTEIN: tumor necrosis factor receptor superfamily member 6B-like n=1 Tax=Gasterosteus aculeatus aculeatus TaxID=481459 RepID=UPI001A9868B0|nr:LOW QUALITY PROTEIN: tumor necrosis factor receptor superfamily member 6B-like [Gasterosteus aculeatus aculeatus]